MEGKDDEIQNQYSKQTSNILSIQLSLLFLLSVLLTSSSFSRLQVVVFFLNWSISLVFIFLTSVNFLLCIPFFILYCIWICATRHHYFFLLKYLCKLLCKQPCKIPVNFHMWSRVKPPSAVIPWLAFMSPKKDVKGPRYVYHQLKVYILWQCLCWVQNLKIDIDIAIQTFPGDFSMFH